VRGHAAVPAPEEDPRGPGGDGGREEQLRPGQRRERLAPLQKGPRGTLRIEVDGDPGIDEVAAAAGLGASPHLARLEELQWSRGTDAGKSKGSHTSPLGQPPAPPPHGNREELLQMSLVAQPKGPQDSTAAH